MTFCTSSNTSASKLSKRGNYLKLGRSEFVPAFEFYHSVENRSFQQ